jgi:hypothetical protein
MPSIKVTRATAIGGVHMAAGTVVPDVDEKVARDLIGMGKAVPVDASRKPIENREAEKKLMTKSAGALKKGGKNGC